MPGVPNTTTFTLADVVAAVLPSKDDLQECFDDSVDGAFDSTYGPGDKSNLLQFRNYGNNTAAQNMVYITQSQLSSSAACSSSRTVKVWKNNNPSSVENGDKFWENEVVSGVDTPGDPYVGGGTFQFFGIFTGLNSASFKLSSLGVVTNKVFCSLPSLVLSDVYYYLSGSAFSKPIDYYYSSDIGDASNLSVGDILYTDAALTTPLGTHSGYSDPNRYFQDGSTASTTICPGASGGDPAPMTTIFVSTANSGVIISGLVCQFP